MIICMLYTFHTYCREYQYVAFIGFNGIFTVHICNCTSVFSFNFYCDFLGKGSLVVASVTTPLTSIFWATNGILARQRKKKSKK